MTFRKNTTTTILTMTLFAGLMIIPLSITPASAELASCPVGHTDNGDDTCTLGFIQEQLTLELHIMALVLKIVIT